MIWKDVLPRVSLGLKITNWCNLCCAHCCERSNNKEPYNLMPVSAVERYIREFKDMGIPVWDYVVFTGGESMAPYYHADGKYIPMVAEICAKNDMSACFKTNAKWGEQNWLNTVVLKSLANIAHKYDRQISLDISIDEYHDNLNGAANVVNSIMNSQYLSAAIPVSLVGLNTSASQYKYQEFVNTLRQKGICVAPMESDGKFVVSKGNNINVMFYEVSGLSKLGRAADNNIKNARPVTGCASADGSDCLVVTNDNQAILNYKYKTTMDNKTIKQVYNELLEKKR